MKKIISLIILLFLVFSLVSCDFDNPPLIGGGNGNNNSQETFNELREKNPNYDIYYQIFIRSFADSDGDGIGDFNGVTENLDYLSDLGVTAIWMLPFNETDTDWNSYHGYRIKDYYNVNPEYGTMDDLENLIYEANSRDINVVMDLVINHTSDTHPWFIEGRNNSSSKYYDYYLWDHESFVGGMKDLNLASELVVSEIKNIVSFWLNKGISGFRFDAAKHLFEGTPGLTHRAQIVQSTNNFLRDLKTHAKTINPNTFFVGEVFDYNYNGYQDYYIGLDSLFDFYVQGEILDKIGGGGNKSLLLNNINNAYKAYERYNPSFITSTFIGNHDIDRLASKSGFNGVDALDRLKLSSAILLTLPGSPHIYYGDELGMKGTDYGGAVYIEDIDKEKDEQRVIYDQYRRAPFKWGDVNKDTTWLTHDNGSDDNPSVIDALNDENSLLNYYKTFSNIRKENPALMFGNQMSLWKDNSNLLQGFIKTYNKDNTKQAVLVIHNLSSQSQNVNVEYKNIIYGNLEIKKYGTLILEIDYNKVSSYIK